MCTFRPTPYFCAYHSLHVHPVTQTFLCAQYLYAQTHTASEGREWRTVTQHLLGDDFGGGGFRGKGGKCSHDKIQVINLLTSYIVEMIHAPFLPLCCCWPSTHIPSVTPQYQDNSPTYETNSADGQVILNPMNGCSRFWFIKQEV